MKKFVFIAQPFDNDKYDRRYEDTYKPAIEKAGFEPYRVDRDPSASIPIDEIEKKITESHMVFSDITLDNPNVWFEVGYAIAKDKEVCFVCSKQRILENKKFPFDVQHRSIIEYSEDSKSSWEKLERDIYDRLNGMNENIKRKNEIVLAIKNNDASDYIQQVGYVLSEMDRDAVAIVASETPAHQGIPFYQFNRKMEENGYNGIGVNVSCSRLIKNSFLEMQEAYDDDHRETYNVLKITDTGWQYIEDNLHIFGTKKQTIKLKAVQPISIELQKEDDEIPF